MAKRQLRTSYSTKCRAITLFFWRPNELLYAKFTNPHSVEDCRPQTSSRRQRVRSCWKYAVANNGINAKETNFDDKQAPPRNELHLRKRDGWIAISTENSTFFQVASTDGEDLKHFMVYEAHDPRYIAYVPCPTPQKSRNSLWSTTKIHRFSHTSLHSVISFRSS